MADDQTTGLSDKTAVVWINDRAIPRGTVTALAETCMSSGIADKGEAYQSALNLIVHNSLFLQEATGRGLIPSDEEVDIRVQELLNDAENNSQQLRDTFIEQASALRATWESPEFEAHLKEQYKEFLPGEKLNEQISEQVQGETQRFNEIKAQLLSELILSASIRLEKKAHPEEA